MIQIERDGQSQLLTFARPAKKNAITSDMYAQLATALREAENDPEIKSTLFTGSEDCFTAGNDIADFLASGGRLDEETPVIQFLHALHNHPKPLVMAVNGLAIGIGTTMLLHADFVYASPNATFKLPFVDLALVPEAASSLLLPKRIGMLNATKMLMLAETLTAEEAHEAGLVQLVSDGSVLDRAKATAEQLNSKAPAAMLATKRLMKAAHHQAVTDQMEAEFKAFAAQLASPELKAVAMKFLSRKG